MRLTPPKKDLLFDLDSNAQDKFRLIASRRLGGIVNFVSDVYPDEYVQYFIQDNVVMMNFECEQSFRLDTVYSDGMAWLIRQAAKFGHKRAAFITTHEPRYMHLDTRIKTFCELRDECGFDTDESLIVGNDIGGKRTSEEIGYELTARLLDGGKKFTCLFCINDMTALGAMRAFHEYGLDIPGDVSVTGCDDISIGKYIFPSLTTLGFDKFVYGREIAKTIIDKIENPQLPYTHRSIESVPVYRNSLGPAKK